MNNLFQFWNTEDPPEEVKVSMASWARNRNFNYRLYNADTSRAYIDQYFDARTLAAFDKCGVPAMQSDFFRYCVLLREGGAYVDASLGDKGVFWDTLSRSDRGVLWRRRGNVANGVIFVRHSNDPLLVRTLKRATENIEGEISNNVWKVTGPGILTDDFWDPKQKALFEGFDFIYENKERDFFSVPKDMPYKRKPTDWRAFLADGAPSIFAGESAFNVPLR